MKRPEPKKRIIVTAETLFSDQGSCATSLRDITAAAEVNLALVSYYFGSKEELLDAVLEMVSRVDSYTDDNSYAASGRFERG